MTSSISPIRKIEPAQNAVGKNPDNPNRYSNHFRNQFITEQAQRVVNDKEGLSDQRADGARTHREKLPELFHGTEDKYKDAEKEANFNAFLSERAKTERHFLKKLEKRMFLARDRNTEKDADFKEYLKALKRKKETQVAQEERAIQSQEILAQGMQIPNHPVKTESLKSDIFIINRLLLSIQNMISAVFGSSSSGSR